MKKPFILLFIILCVIGAASSQTAGLSVKLGARGLFVEHQVAAKENFYSIGRDFNVHPRRLAAFNGLDMSKGLSLGQVVNIPLSDTNLVRKSGEGIPVYYRSTLKQTVGSISAISKTSGENLREMNKMAADNIPANTKVIIGYLVAGSQVATVGNSLAEKETVEEIKKPEEDSTAGKVIEHAVTQPAKNDAVIEKPKEVVKETPRVVQVKQEPEKVSSQEDGYFRASFLEQVKSNPLSKEETLTCGVFKTTSGWGDAKYYALIDRVEPGTVIRITNPNNNKQVYAKVLGPMSGIRQNQGLNVRISNAAASNLEISETDKFIVKVNY